MKSNRVLIVGLDGATWDVLDPWIVDGSLPYLARLRQSGSWGVLHSTIPPLSAPAWSTFMTGKGPGKHGVFHFIRLFDEGGAVEGEPEIVNARSIRSSTLWDVMGHYDRRVVVINMPMTYPPRPVNGVMITGLLTPRNASTFTYPPELSRELTDYIIDLDRFIGKKPFLGDDFDPGTTTPTLSLVQEFQDMLDKRARTALSLMESKPWDVFVVVFTGTDRMGHYLWPYHRHPQAGDPLQVQELCRAVHSYYVRLDQVVGELTARGGRDTTSILMSDHGMGPKNTRWIHLNNWLYQNGWLSAKAAGSQIANPDGWLRRLGLSRDKAGRMISRIPGLARSRLIKSVAQKRSIGVDTARSKAYGVRVWGNITGIQIDLEGPEKEALCREIVEGLARIVDPETGQPVVQRVYRGQDCYHGPYANHVPDIIVAFDPDYACNYHLGCYSSIVTRLQAVSSEGYHRIEGIFVASGPHVVSNPEPLSGLDIEDLAPTVLYLMDLPIPADMDGRVLTEILSPTGLESRPVRPGEPSGLWPDEGQAVFIDETLTDRDEGEVRERLRALGYLD